MRSQLYMLVAIGLLTITVLAKAAAPQEKALHITFDQAENEVLGMFRQDLPRLEGLTSKFSIFEVTATGTLPNNYIASLKSKLERVTLTSNKLRVIDCPQCQVSRLVKDAEGKLRYEVISEEPGRAGRLAKQIGVEDLLYADVNYTSSDLRLRVRLVKADNGELLFSREYSTADLVKRRDNLIKKEYGIEDVGQGDSLSRMLIGEIAFTVAFSPGTMLLPTIDDGKGSSRMFYPSIDILIGEKFDGGHKRFGFLFGAAVNAAEQAEVGKLLPYAIRFAPQYRYTFNPYDTSFARYSILTEMGGLLSAGMVTAYAGFGPEVTIVRRFSLSLMPMYILPANVKGVQIVNATEGKPDATVTTPDQGRFGGFAILLKGTMNW